MGELKAPKVSVIIAAYNQEKFIGRCLRSLMHQSIPHRDYEIIIVNDGSEDLTQHAISQFIDPFNSLVKVIQNESNMGLPISLNRALKSANAEWVVRVDADDYVNFNFLLFLSFYLSSNSASAVACDYFLVDDKEEVLRRCCSVDEPIACGIMFRKKCLFDIGLYDENFLSNEDKDLKLRFEAKYKVDHLNLPLYRYRKHATNMTNNEDRMKHFDVALKDKHGL